MTNIPDAAVERKRKQIDPNILNELFDYDAGTGILYHRKRGVHLFSNTVSRTQETNSKWWNGRFAGKRACKSDCRNGYMRVSIFGTEYQAHRVIWAMMKGAWPKDVIDHVDGDKENNRTTNLREATTSQNNMNRKGSGKSKYKGVSWRKSQEKWIASIKCNNKQHFLGLFDDEKEAAKAYDSAAIVKHGCYAKLNFTQADFERRVRECIDITNDGTKPVDVAAGQIGMISEGWSPLKKALWNVLMEENINDGHYIKAFEFIEKLHSAAIRALSSEPAQGEQSDIAWLNTKTNFEVSNDWPEGGDEGDQGVWKIHSVNGGRSDREWTLIAEDSDLSTAISKARKAFAAPTPEAEA